MNNYDSLIALVVPSFNGDDNGVCYFWYIISIYNILVELRYQNKDNFAKLYIIFETNFPKLVDDSVMTTKVKQECSFDLERLLWPPFRVAGSSGFPTCVTRGVTRSKKSSK